ncbi:hypothetical protein AB0P05_41595 [Streptomyces flaveolus]|uniref:hypothetical protein n=1 Tax=Streptomyces flaveolus TaxID=67297 RepID=UPI00342ADDF0
MPDTTPLAPMTPHEAISAFSYLRAVQADDADAARALAGAEPRMPELLVDAATRIVVPVTALPGPDLRIWAQAGPDTAEGIARAVIDFAQQFLTEDHEDVADTLRQLEAVGVGQALEAHPAPASHPVRLTAL